MMDKPVGTRVEARQALQTVADHLLLADIALDTIHDGNTDTGHDPLLTEGERVALHEMGTHLTNARDQLSLARLGSLL